MKTTEQIKSEVVSYLNKTAKHLFVKENGEFYNVIVEGDNFILINGDKVTVYNVNDYVTWYGVNAKNTIKHILFLNRKLKSIKNFKVMRDKVSSIKEAVAGKTDKAEITKIVTQLVTGIVIEDRKSFISKLFGK